MGPAARGDLGTLIFTYGTLKRGFSNHGLLRDLIDSGDAAYLGDYQTAEKLPLVCGPYRVPFLLNLPGAGDRVWGELYAVSPRALARMDELEGTTRGHYERLPITLLRQGGEEEEPVEVEAYYAHRSYAAELWKRSGEKGYSCYGEIESKLLGSRVSCCCYSLFYSFCRGLKHMLGSYCLKLLQWVLFLSGRLLPVGSF